MAKFQHYSKLMANTMKTLGSIAGYKNVEHKENENIT